jgi:predicted transcriptional regulator
MTELTRALKNMEKKLIKLNGGNMAKKKKVIGKKVEKKVREVMTQKQAREKMNQIKALVDSGDMGVTRACREIGMPIWKYSYWKNIFEEQEALDDQVKEAGEILIDTSPAAVRERANEILNLQREVIELRARIKGHEKKVEDLKEENGKLKDALLKKLLEL